MRTFGITMILFLSALIALIIACSDNNNNPTYPFERTVLDVSIVKRPDSYLMRWQHPIEKKDLQNYYIWLDTTIVRDSVQDISQSQMNQADAIIAYSGKGDGDSLSLKNLINSFLERDSLHIAIWAAYSGSEQGAVQHIHIYFGDDIKPATADFSYSISANTIWLDWTRPTDQRNFYLPEDISGPIAGYNVIVQANDRNENIRDANVKVELSGTDISSSNIKRFYEFRKNGRGVKLEPTMNTNANFLGVAIIDEKGFDATEAKNNSWRMIISDLKPEHSYTVTIIAWDSTGNFSTTEGRIATTDLTPPTIANEFWYYKDPNENSFAYLNSNRLILFWIRSLDPIYGSTQSREVKSYLIEQENGATWEVSPNTRYSLINDSMRVDANGLYVSDTLHYILPGDIVTLRMRAIDSSRHYSADLVETIITSKGELWQYNCPPNFAAVKMNTTVFCMEKLQHSSNEKDFDKNVLYIEAKKICEDAGYYLCTEQEWNAACTSGGSSYGVIEGKNFNPSSFLSGNCGVGTGDSLSAYSINKRKKICANPDGIRDLPGQLQEWVIGKDAAGKEIPLLKGSSYAVFSGASIVELAQCKNSFTPTRIRPKYTTESVYLYRVGSRIDTLLYKDPLRTNLYAVLNPSEFTDVILVYTLKSSAGEELGTDYVNQVEYNKRGGDKWLDVLWQGLNYELKEKRKVLILGTESIKASDFFLDPTVGFRCCTEI